MVPSYMAPNAHYSAPQAKVNKAPSRGIAGLVTRLFLSAIVLLSGCVAGQYGHKKIQAIGPESRARFQQMKQEAFGQKGHLNHMPNLLNVSESDIFWYLNNQILPQSMYPAKSARRLEKVLLP